MSGQIPIYNIQTYDQKKLLALPSVIVRRVESINIPRNILAGITGATGGRNIEMEKKMNDMMVGLIDDLKKEALRVNNKVVALLGLDIQYSEIGKSSGNMFLSAQAIATPIIRRPVTQNTRPPSLSESVASESVAPVAPAMPQMPPAVPMPPVAPAMPPVAPAMPPVPPVAPVGPVAPGPSMPPFGSQPGNQISQMRGGSNKTRGRRIRKRSHK
jgi:uncharacterized protein YbjQ (UPF0145 family)